MSYGESESHLSRRDLLRAGGTALAAAAGCIGPDSTGSGTDGQTGTNTYGEDTPDRTQTDTPDGQTVTPTARDDGPIYDGQYFTYIRTNDPGNRVRFDIAGWPDQWAGGPGSGGPQGAYPSSAHPKDSRDAEGRLVVHIYDDAPTVSNGEERADRGCVAPGIHTENEVLAYLADTGLFGGEPQVAFVDAPEDDGGYVIRHDGPVQDDDLQAITDAGVTVARIDPTDYVSASSVNSPRFAANIYHKDGEAGRYDGLPAINIGFDMP